MSPEDQDEMMLEDESGRLRVTGESLKSHYVTGCILAALGTEQADGTFRVIATQYADLPRQPQRWERQDAALSRSKDPVPMREPSGKLAIVSGLEITGHGVDDLSLDLLVEFLTGEALAPSDQSSSSNIARLLICGDSLNSSSPILSRDAFAAKKAATKHYGYDASSTTPPPPSASTHFSPTSCPPSP